MTLAEPATPATDARDDNVGALHDFVDGHRRLFVLTGAGISTASGIPDYRDRDGGWKGATPIQHQAFVDEPAKRKRYWARSMAGWPPMARARPNAAHEALARMGAIGRTHLVVTQNVDGLHQAAGSRTVIDLHGRLDRVICLDCDTKLSRDRVQAMLIERNRDWLHASDAIRPDGDIELGDVDYDVFNVPACPVCRGILKPDVVFFGGAVPASRVTRAWAGLQSADAVLVAGSSLMVWSGFRFVREAAGRGLPVMAVNRGRTRADDLITHKLDDDCVTLLDAVVDRVSSADC